MPPGKPVPPPLRLAQRYPLETLTPVAEFLLGELKRRGATALLHAGIPGGREQLSLAIDPEPSPTAAEQEPVLPQPETSKISYIPAPDALTFIIPRTGFRGTALFFLVFSLFWDGISFTFFAVMFVQLIHLPTLEHLGMLGFISIFVAIGIGTLLTAIQSAFRRAVILAGRGGAGLHANRSHPQI